MNTILYKWFSCVNDDTIDVKYGGRVKVPGFDSNWGSRFIAYREGSAKANKNPKAYNRAVFGKVFPGDQTKLYVYYRHSFDRKVNRGS